MTETTDWDARYAAGRQWSVAPNATLAEVLARFEPGSAIDLGAGEGRHAIWLAGLGWHVVAVDVSQVALDRGRDTLAGLESGAEPRAEGRGDVEWVAADVTRWTPVRPVDLVLLAYLHLPAATLNALLRRGADWLAPGGRMVLLGHDVDNLTRGTGGPQHPDVLYDADRLAEVLAGRGLDVTTAQQVERPVSAGVAIDALVIAERPAAQVRADRAGGAA